MPENEKYAPIRIPASNSVAPELNECSTTVATLFEAGMRIGAYFSFSGMITFKNWQSPVALSDYPPDRLLVETDAPYLAPVPHRGKRNEPAFVPAVAEALGRALGASLADIAQRTTDNARRVFGARLATTLSGEADS